VLSGARGPQSTSYSRRVWLPRSVDHTHHDLARHGGQPHDFLVFVEVRPVPAVDLYTLDRPGSWVAEPSVARCRVFAPLLAATPRLKVDCLAAGQETSPEDRRVSPVGTRSRGTGRRGSRTALIWGEISTSAVAQGGTSSDAPPGADTAQPDGAYSAWLVLSALRRWQPDSTLPPS
jgi:hypothetical protein